MSTITIDTQYVSLVPTNKHLGMTKGFIGTFDIISSYESLGIKENDGVIIAAPIKNDLAFVSEGIIIKIQSINKHSFINAMIFKIGIIGRSSFIP